MLSTQDHIIEAWKMDNSYQNQQFVEEYFE